MSLILDRHDVQYKLYADDTQIYITLDYWPNDVLKVKSMMKDLKAWMSGRKLELNVKKTKCMLIGSPRNLARYSDIQKIQIDDNMNNEVELVKYVVNLGVILDEHLNMKQQINNVVKIANNHLRNIAFIRKYLDQSSTHKLVQSNVISRLDYCNSIYVNLPYVTLKKIQTVFNRAARLITGTPYRSHITPVLIDLHWLPVKARIEFKICVLTYKALMKNRPRYIYEKLTRYETGHIMNTRVAVDPERLLEPRCNLEMGARMFSYSAPRIYNKLPLYVRQASNIELFKKRLKTFLFGQCYDHNEKVITDGYKL